MTITDAVKEAMRIRGGPLTIREAHDAIIASALYNFNAEHPEQIVASQIRRHCKDLDFPSASPTKYFELKEDGKYYFLESPIKQSTRRVNLRSSDTSKNLLSQLKKLHLKHQEEVRKKILYRLQHLDPKVFEFFSKRLLDAYGFIDTKVTQYSKDGGIDGHGKLKVGLANMNVAFQCKRYGNKAIGRPEVDRFRGAIQGQYEQGIFFTTSMFCKGVEAFSFRPGAVPIILIDGKAIVDIMIEKRFGVQLESLPVYSYALDLVLEDDTL